MVRIAASGEWTFCVPASLPSVYDFFAEPAQLCALLDSVDSYAVLEAGRVRWILKEKVEKGIHFKGDYTVVYEGNGIDHVHWHGIEGNMGGEGDVWLSATPDGGTKIRYRETVAPDLPITALMARLMQPIVARELRTELETFLERVKVLFGVSHDKS